jgi:hypothetical protein
VESSQNRSVLWAGVPHWGQGMVSGMVRSDLVAVDGSLAATSLPARMRGAGMGKQCRNARNLRVMRHRLAVRVSSDPRTRPAALECAARDSNPEPSPYCE